jgi:hypothetical protein
MYAILMLIEKGDKKILEDFLVVSNFVNVFPEELLGLPPNRELKFTIDLKLGIEPIVRMPYLMSTHELLELNMQLKE